ncbi:putative DNA breaking-rejoining enzyme, catalytic core, integrase-like, catalytic domain superfamily [Plasmopara halstedii]
MKPIHARSSTILNAKKSLSAFMPRKSVPWDPIRQEGNLTRSDSVNMLIKQIKKAEVRKEGVASSARRPLEYMEFLSLLSTIRESNEKTETMRMVCSVFTLQWHLITRIDDMMKLRFDNLAPNIQHSGTLQCQMRWSKNISEERDAPEQILLGSMDPSICPLLNFAVYHEVNAHAPQSAFCFGNPDVGDRVVRRVLKSAFASKRFKSDRTGLLGTHSLRKGATTYAMRSGVSKDYVDRRGRWRSRKSTVDIYIHNTQPYPDAVVASTLAGPLGPCFYALKDGMRCVSTSLLVDCIAPTIKQVIGESVSRTLALPLLWASLSPEGSIVQNVIPSSLKTRVIEAYRGAGGDPDVNPVERIGFHVAGDGAQLQLIEMREVDDATMNSAGSGHGSISADGQRKEFAALHAHLFGLYRKVDEVMHELLRLRNDFQHMDHRNQANLRRIALQPVVRTVASIPTATPSASRAPDSHHTAARLCKRPRDLFELWHEYEFGCGGSKPAKEFTSKERGAEKSKFCRRKAFWDVVGKLVRAGYTSDVAIDKVYAAYGRRNSITKILESMSKSTHPSLCV